MMWSWNQEDQAILDSFMRINRLKPRWLSILWERMEAAKASFIRLEGDGHQWRAYAYQAMRWGIVRECQRQRDPSDAWQAVAIPDESLLKIRPFREISTALSIGANQDEVLESADVQAQTLAAMANLDASQQSLLLDYFGRRPHALIAKRMGLSPKALDARIARLLVKCKPSVRCVVCGQECPKGNRRFCSAECKKKDYENRLQSTIALAKAGKPIGCIGKRMRADLRKAVPEKSVEQPHCVVCGAELHPDHRARFRAKFCGKKCMNRFHNAKKRGESCSSI